jgi:hypothetical protein
MHWLKSSKNNTNQQLLKSKHLRVSYLEAFLLSGIRNPASSIMVFKS